MRQTIDSRLRLKAVERKKNCRKGEDNRRKKTREKQTISVLLNIYVYDYDLVAGKKNKALKLAASSSFSNGNIALNIV